MTALDSPGAQALALKLTIAPSIPKIFESLGAFKLMTRRTAESYRRRLLAKERELLMGITRIELDGRRADIIGAQDLADQADNCYTKESLFQQSSNARNLLILVRAALRRDDVGDFGLCVECGEPVQRKRLEAVPWARHCVACQELQEKGLL
jgi:RNA polymerase-binding transcription factor